MLKPFKEFYNDKLLEQLILEANMEFSKNFLNLLNTIKDNKVAKELLRINSQKVDADFTHNFIDSTEDPETITFTPQRKANQILENPIIKWKVLSDGGRGVLTHNKNEDGKFKNKDIFKRLGYVPEGDPWHPEEGTTGTLRGEVISNTTGRIYVWFFSDTDESKNCVINKERLVAENESYEKVWKTSRNPFKVGRFARTTLNVAGINFTDKDVEDFVNAYKASHNIMNDALSKFELVEGYDIAHWYNYENYENQSSVLGNSCMKEVDDDYFDIYVKNSSKCKMLILYSDKGRTTIKDGKFKSDKIKGRAIIWTLDDGNTFMDRIYTNYDSDVDLFKTYAEKNNWFYKVRNNSDVYPIAVSNGKSTIDRFLATVTLEHVDLDSYPYIDTICYLNIDDKKISNKREDIEAKYIMRSTGGSKDRLD